MRGSGAGPGALGMGIGPRYGLALLVAAVFAIVVGGCGAKSPIGPGGGTGGSGGGSGGTGGGSLPPNTPPVVKAIVGTEDHAEAGHPFALIATVEDAETPVDKLTYAWSAPTGTFSGTGASVQWTPGADVPTPADITITLTVTETYTSGTTQLQNTAQGTASVHLNDSPKELADLSLRFLGNFADSKVSPETCVSEFTTNCNGKKDEFDDITSNRHDFQVLSSTLRHTGIDPPSSKGKTTVHTFCAFTSRVITQDPVSCSRADCPFNSVQSVKGDCFTTNVYEHGRWWLCESHFNGDRALTGFDRGFFGIRGADHP
jgi:hypothetical protein